MTSVIDRLVCRVIGHAPFMVTQIYNDPRITITRTSYTTRCDRCGRMIEVSATRGAEAS
jgi:hypothetical protein